MEIIVKVSWFRVIDKVNNVTINFSYSCYKSSQYSFDSLKSLEVLKKETFFKCKTKSLVSHQLQNFT